MTELERGKCGYSVPAATCIPSILEYLFSSCCRRTATSGKARIWCGHREACPAQCLQSWPTPHKLLGFPLGHISFFLILNKTRTLGLTISTFSLQTCVSELWLNWLRELSRFTVRASGKSMASWHCTVEFHSPCASSFGQTVLTMEDRQMGSGKFTCVFLSIEDR